MKKLIKNTKLEKLIYENVLKPICFLFSFVFIVFILIGFRFLFIDYLREFITLTQIGFIICTSNVMIRVIGMEDKRI